MVADGDPATTWYAADSDRQPWVRLTWPKARTITGLRMTLPPTAAAGCWTRAAPSSSTGRCAATRSPCSSPTSSRPARTTRTGG
ncbi:hypothetical protein [Micromonospora globispora]|uniref:hypothetical protein n=1 Tax=Micromonospora globispora TaxID=1450148 RepID=UPI003F689B72